MDCDRSPLATAPITRATSAVGCTMSSISSFTASIALSQPPVALLTRPRWLILPSLPTTIERRWNSCAICSLRPTTSLNSWASSASCPVRSSGKRTRKSPRRTKLGMTAKGCFRSLDVGFTPALHIRRERDDVHPCGLTGASSYRPKPDWPRAATTEVDANWRPSPMTRAQRLHFFGRQETGGLVKSA